MAEELRVDGRVVEGVICLTVYFDQELLLKKGAHERLSTEVKNRYREIRERGESIKTSCVVEIQSEIGASALVRALFELRKEVVEQEGGQVICVNYPDEYIDSLNALGLTALEGFSLAGSKEDAFSRIKK